MSCVSKTVLLCLAIILLAQVTCKNLSDRSNCLCFKTTNRVPRKENIESYMIQKAGVCHIDAILFKTVKGRFICADPQSSSAINAMQYVKMKAFEKTRFLINPTSTFKRRSTLITTSDWNGEDELRTILPELLQFVNTATSHSFCPCLKTSETVLSKEDIKSYKIRKADICHIDAIEFKTVNGLTVCSNPQKLWVKRAMQFVDKKANETTAHPMNSTSTFKTASVQNTTSHWNGQDELSDPHEQHEYFYICL